MIQPHSKHDKQAKSGRQPDTKTKEPSSPTSRSAYKLVLHVLFLLLALCSSQTNKLACRLELSLLETKFLQEAYAIDGLIIVIDSDSGCGEWPTRKRV